MQAETQRQRQLTCVSYQRQTAKRPPESKHCWAERWDREELQYQKGKDEQMPVLYTRLTIESSLEQSDITDPPATEARVSTSFHHGAMSGPPSRPLAGNCVLMYLADKLPKKMACREAVVQSDAARMHVSKTYPIDARVDRVIGSAVKRERRAYPRKRKRDVIAFRVHVVACNSAERVQIREVTSTGVGYSRPRRRRWCARLCR